MSEFLRNNLGYTEEISDINFKIGLHNNDKSTVIINEDESVLDKIFSLIRKREGLYIFIKNNISFDISISSPDEDIFLNFYENINGNLVKIEKGLFAILDSNGINEEAILSALKSNLENPRLVDTNITIKAQVEDIIRGSKKPGKSEVDLNGLRRKDKIEQKEQEEKIKESIILNNRLLIVMPGFNPLVGEDKDSIEEINNMLNNIDFEIPSKFYVGIFKDMLINIYEYGYLKGYKPNEKLEESEKENKYISCIEQLFGKVNREEVMKIIDKLF